MSEVEEKYLRARDEITALKRRSDEQEKVITRLKSKLATACLALGPIVDGRCSRKYADEHRPPARGVSSDLPTECCSIKLLVRSDIVMHHILAICRQTARLKGSQAI
jgi:hypothetical protein